MSTIINTNSLSLLTQNNLNKSQASLNTAIQRLSSGLRINSAKDDAAGQAIANRFTANIKGLTQSQRNANDGISLAQTTEGALGEVNTNLQRIRELAVQSTNGSNSAADKTSIQAEITQRLQEIDRTSSQTDFNGVKVLASTAGKLSIQIGANDNENISIDLQEISAKTLGLTGFNVDGTGSKNSVAARSDLLTAGFTPSSSPPVNGTQQYSKTTTVTNAPATSANVFSKLATNDSLTNTAAVTTSFGSQAAGKVFTYDKSSDSFSYSVASASNALVSAALIPTPGGSTAAKVTIGTNASQDILIAGDGKITAADDKSVLFLDASGNLTKTNAGGSSQATLASLQTSMNSQGTAANNTGGTILANGTTFTTAAATTSPTFSVTNAKISASALKTLVDPGGYVATSALGSATSGTATVAAGGASVAGTGFTNVTASGAFTGDASTATVVTFFEQSNSVITDGSANVVYNDSAAAGKFTLNATSGSTVTVDPLKTLDAALSKVDKLRGALGAVQNRFDSVISNLGTTINNLTSSRSRIEDADYATEVSNLTRAQILQQAGTSVLAKANQSTEGVLSLLR